MVSLGCEVLLFLKEGNNCSRNREVGDEHQHPPRLTHVNIDNPAAPEVI